ncbi:MAG: hypothetical protein K9L30_01635 [Desulfobacterales bacterium]|nr:hypothetical protein [Desulfobacterales bacterium]
MKKFAILALAAMMVIALTIPASAEKWFGPEIGGDFKAIGFQAKNMQGYDSELAGGDYDDFSGVMQRTNLYLDIYIGDYIGVYTALEFETIWGSNNGANGRDTGFGYVGGTNDGAMQVVEALIQLYPDEYLLNVGKHWILLNRGFMQNDYMSGVSLDYYDVFGLGNFQFVWFLEQEEYNNPAGGGTNADLGDMDQYYLIYKWAGEEMAFEPFIMYQQGKGNTQKNATASWAQGGYPSVWAGQGGYDTTYFGFDWDWNVESDVAFGLWATGIYETGEMEMVTWLNDYSGRDMDMTGYLAAFGGNYFVAAGDMDIELHGQFVYASGDDPATLDEYEGFIAPTGASYYWAEVLGYGRNDFIDYGWQGAYAYDGDNQEMSNGMGYITNQMIFGIGASTYLTPKIQTGLDLWYVMLPEDDSAGNNDIGTEVDAFVTYELVDECFLTLVGGYVFTGDAIYAGADQENMYEVSLIIETTTW